MAQLTGEGAPDTPELQKVREELTLTSLDLLISLLGFVWSSGVMTVVWAWYAVPFLQLPALSLGAVIGIRSLVKLFLGPNHEAIRRYLDEGITSKCPSATQLKRACFVAFGVPLVPLSLAWLGLYFR